MATKIRKKSFVENGRRDKELCKYPPDKFPRQSARTYVRVPTRPTSSQTTNSQALKVDKGPSVRGLLKSAKFSLLRPPSSGDADVRNHFTPDSNQSARHVVSKGALVTRSSIVHCRRAAGHTTSGKGAVPWPGGLPLRIAPAGPKNNFRQKG